MYVVGMSDLATRRATEHVIDLLHHRKMVHGVVALNPSHVASKLLAADKELLQEILHGVFNCARPRPGSWR